MTGGAVGAHGGKKKSAPAFAGALGALAWVALGGWWGLAGSAYEEDSANSDQGYYCQDQGYDPESSAAAGYSG